MKEHRILKQLAVIFLLALIGYFGTYSFIQHRRVAKGPWQVAFTNDSGAPAMIVNQPALQIHDVRIVFAGARAGTNTEQTLRFSEPHAVPFDVPFGKCVFLDPLFLPGTVAFEMFGHEIQFLPRALTIDGKENPWQSNARLVLTNGSARSK